jgi:hypothetical protein
MRTTVDRIDDVCQQLGGRVDVTARLMAFWLVLASDGEVTETQRVAFGAWVQSELGIAFDARGDAPLVGALLDIWEHHERGRELLAWGLERDGSPALRRAMLRDAIAAAVLKGVRIADDGLAVKIAAQLGWTPRDIVDATSELIEQGYPIVMVEFTGEGGPGGLPESLRETSLRVGEAFYSIERAPARPKRRRASAARRVRAKAAAPKRGKR